MNKITCIIILLLTGVSVFAQDNDCARMTNFGTAEICLPVIDGYKECYPDSIVKQMADATEVPVNMVIGFYLNDETYAKKDSFGLFTFDDYFKIYGTKQIKDYQADESLLHEIQDVLAGSFIEKNWDVLKKEMSEVNSKVKIEAPTIIKKYNINDASFTYIMLTEYAIEGMKPHTMAMSINGYLSNERLIWMAYYLNYQDEETMVKLQKKSNFILAELSKNSK